MKITLSVTFDDWHDRDLLRRLAAEPNRSAAIREALRNRYAGVTLADVYRAIQELSRIYAGLKRTGLVEAACFDEVATDEPPDLADALDSLGTSS
jgi:hypothetical protein